MAPWLVIVLDCRDPESLAPFWTAALGYIRRDPVDQYEVLTPAESGGGPPLLLQRVAEPRTGKNRMHLDLHVDDIDTEVARLEELGATRIGEGSLGDDHQWVILADPEGNEFCVAGP